jgi:hypothetical protein
MINLEAKQSMPIEFISRDLQAPPDLRTWALESIAASLGRFHRHLRKVVVRVDDINGPRGGFDKTITINLEVRGGGSKVIRQRGTSYEAAIVSGLRRAKQVLQRSPKVGGRRPRRGVPDLAFG